MLKRAAIARRLQRGFSMLEMLLTVGVFSAFFLFLIQLGQIISKDQAHRAAANYVADVDRALSAIISTPARFNIMYNAVSAIGINAQTDITNLVNGTGIFAGLPRSPVLDANFPTTAPFGQTYRIIFRIADNPAIATDVRALETFVISQNLVEDQSAHRIAGLISGGSGGALRNTANATAGTIRGAYGNWSIPMANLAGTGWHAAVTTSATAPTVDNGGYIGSYRYYNMNKVARDYLYRTNVGDASLNTMGSDLSLGSYNLLGADDVTVAGTATGSEMIVQGTTNLGAATSISGGLQADGPSTTAGISGNGTTPVQVSVPNGSVATSGATTTSGAVFGSGYSTGTLNAGAVTSNATTLTGTASATMNANATSGIFAGVPPTGLNITAQFRAGQLKTTNLDGAGLTQSAGYVSTLYLQTTGNATLSGGVQKSEKIAVPDPLSRLNARGRTRTNTFGTCGSGC